MGSVIPDNRLHTLATDQIGVVVGLAVATAAAAAAAIAQGVNERVAEIVKCASILCPRNARQVCCTAAPPFTHCYNSLHVEA